MDTTTQNLLIILSMVGYALMEWVTRRYRDTVHATPNDTRLELFMFVSLLAVAQPLALGLSGRLCGWLMPEARGAWADLPWWAMVSVLLLADDLTQYLWHRASHTPLLWPLHRAHHTASYMSIRITYRNNFFYYLMMPGLWIGGVLVYLGFGAVYAAYVVVKLIVILGGTLRLALGRAALSHPRAAPLMWVVERTISTPATHWAHHALTNADGVGHYTGNFGNLLFVGRAPGHCADHTPLPRTRSDFRTTEVFGAEHWAHQMFYPLLQSKRARSALRFGGRAAAVDETRGDAAGARHPAAEA